MFDAVPGLGSLLVKAIEVRDYNVIMAVSFLYSVMYIVNMLVIDVLYGYYRSSYSFRKGG